MRSLALASCIAISGAAAHAQAPASPATPPAQTAPPAPSQPTNCAPMTPRGTIAPNGATVGQSNDQLGDKLAKSDGTLCPPSGIDPEIRAPTPEGGKMPVIPPPGSPGGDPSVRPK
ncbi:hypothetical protein [Bradyrhizobium sp.]|uniref:hypothetical protein n=1 Tax=Bradyrhizobium sp. TaxID=376 RepID=UPI0039C87148